MHVAAVVDILNQSELLLGWDRLPQQLGHDKFSSAVARSLQPVSMVRRQLKNLIDDYVNVRPSPDKLLRITPALRTEFESLTKCEIRTHFFADTSIAFASLHQDGRPSGPKVIHGILAGTAVLMLTSLAQRIAIRGGIDAGMGANAFEGEVYGPVVVKAHHLESKLAGHPRILVGQSLMQVIQSCKNDARTTPLGAATRTMGNSAEQLVFTDADGHSALDYLGQEMQETLKSVPRLSEIVHAAHDFVTSEGTRFASDPKLGPRYHKVIEYFEARIKLWK